ncbi:MAG: nucleoside-diphosphate kinase [Candidatus Schekmanbacteria bacterium RBG_13_48_7]|uniref:Nucleoside diphosphate kinase n=1 Tax=Candidatus Schekmanbacteria bacterium RBG_13_48_7 TaxID=1817878 RepID=A0A1F7RQ31_9BACT|nr:MAG: nucleoside-diphosphate kinase [Candidatus Schekmanbacteria bacterium RBG_13_48_7]
MNRTLGIIKPDAVKRRLIGEILKRIEKNGLKIIALKMVFLTKEQAKQFYIVHKDKPFYNSVTNFMSSGPVIVMVLEGKRIIEEWRQLMGATDPSKSDYGTIRREFGTSIESNCVHGSDAQETAKTEIAFFFDEKEFVTYD